MAMHLSQKYAHLTPILFRLMSNEVVTKMNMSGSRGKSSFKKTSTYAVVVCKNFLFISKLIKFYFICF